MVSVTIIIIIIIICAYYINVLLRLLFVDKKWISAHFIACEHVRGRVRFLRLNRAAVIITHVTHYSSVCGRLVSFS